MLSLPPLIPSLLLLHPELCLTLPSCSPGALGIFLLSIFLQFKLIPFLPFMLRELSQHGGAAQLQTGGS